MPNALSRGIFNLFFGAKRKPFASLPGPQPGILGTAGDFLGASPWDVCARYGREYGGVTLIWMGPNPGLVLNDPALIAEVYESPRRMEFEKGNISEQIRPSTTDDTSFTAELRGDWVQKRDMEPTARPWAAESLAEMVGPMQAAISESVDALLKRDAIDLAPDLRRLTFDAFSVALVSEKLPDQVFEDFMLLAKAADARIQAKLPLKFVKPPKGFEEAKARFYGHFVDRIREARKRQGSRAVDVMSRYLEEQPGIDDQVLAHMLGGTYFGGAFSSSVTLVGAFHQLNKYPQAAERLAAEAASLVADGPLTFGKLEGAKWTEAVAFESLRILPAVRVMTRTPSKDARLAGVTLPAGSMIMITNQHLHRDPAHWPDPDTFKPERWLDGGTTRDPLGSGHFFPFGRGPRACVGADFAMTFLKTALATIASRVKVHVDSTEPFEEGFFFGVVLPKGVTGKLVARTAPSSEDVRVRSA
ncbi:cytochrome P450 [Corallococcus carmarthensis]|uniref:Cytochrome P450 n=1 Tax=Corallococcus carmarthensis TaxID=2316728 RepID=A0A3A8KJ39_9BACT|nr:cytochrome P450 [Corallococcus carmarthensis]RKH04221.1 cytochrome P450 [Corallococcus carmarthensis]